MTKPLSLQIQTVRDQLKKGISTNAKKYAKSSKVVTALGKQAAENVKIRTRLGFGVKTLGGSREDLKAMKPHAKSYTDFRLGKIAFFTDKFGRKIPYKPKIKPKLSQYTSPKKNNLTFSGDMLENIRGGYDRPGYLKLFFNETRKDGKKNSDIATYNEKSGRKFFNLTDKEILKLSQELRRMMVEYFNRVNI